MRFFVGLDAFTRVSSIGGARSIAKLNCSARGSSLTGVICLAWFISFAASILSPDGGRRYVLLGGFGFA